MTTNENDKGRGGQLSAPAPLIGIVGPCGAGKTTLAEGLNRNGIRARAIVQEHSYVKDMWQRLTRPDVLIFLQASRSAGTERRKLNWTDEEWAEQQRRLQHARAHADFYIETDSLTAEQVLERTLKYLKRQL
jgi:ABC-type glutathione transport system ATPase component